MSLEQRTRDYFASGGTALPGSSLLSRETEYESGSMRWSGEPKLSNLDCQRPRVFVVSSGTSSEVVGYVHEGYSFAELMGNTSIMSMRDALTKDIARFSGRKFIEGVSLVSGGSFILGANVDYEAAVTHGCRIIQSNDYTAALMVISGGTALHERRNRETAVATLQRAEQREKNKSAIGLLEAWLAEEADTASEATSLNETIKTLNAERSHSRKLFP